MGISIFAFMFARICACGRQCLHVMYMCVNIHCSVDVFVCRYVYMFAYVYVCAYVCVYVCEWVGVCIRVRV